MLRKLRFFEVLIRLVKVLAVTIFVIMMGAMVVQVIFRYLLNSPIAWIEEFARFMFIWMIYLGVIISMEQGLLHRVNYFIDLLPGKLRACVYVIVNALVFWFLAFLIISGWQVVNRFSKVRSISLEWPWKYIYLSVVFSAIIMSLISMRNLAQSILDLIKTLGLSTLNREEVKDKKL